MAAEGSANAASPLFRRGDVRVTYLSFDGATGHGLTTSLVRNVSARTCHTRGFPGIALFDRRGRRLRLPVTRATHSFFGRVPKRRVVLAPRKAARFFVGFVEIPTGNQRGCPTARTLRLIMPDDNEMLGVSLRRRNQRQSLVTPCSAVTVTPVTTLRRPRSG